MSAESVLADLAALRERYRELQELTRRQAGVIAAGDVQLLQRLVDQKQRMMGEIAAINARTQQWRAAAGEVAEADRAAINRAVEAAQQELAALLKVEEESQKALSSQRDDTSDKIRELNKARKARNVYGGGSTDSRFIDRGG